MQTPRSERIVQDFFFFSMLQYRPKSFPLKSTFNRIGHSVATACIPRRCLSCLSLPKGVTNLQLRFEKSTEKFADFRVVADAHDGGNICIGTLV